jgi:hypothetical protein
MNFETLIQEDYILHGFITEQNFDQAEEAFPGIALFYEQCRRKPRTFLDLVWQFEDALADRKDILQARLSAGLSIVTW